MANSRTVDHAKEAKLNDQWNAFVTELDVMPTGLGKLSEYTFAAKDVFHIDGYTSGAGNPDWLRTHKPATEHAVTIKQLLQSGARLVGTTHTDELMFSLNGQNAHYGTPINPVAQERIPGGSSSGSAVAVAAGMVDFALGTDTGGSVRVPAAYCGIYGFRPTHGVVSTEGVIPLAKSFDTVGWMARDMKTMVEVGEVLLEREHKKAKEIDRVYFSEEAWELASTACYDKMNKAANALVSHITSSKWIKIAGDGLASWMSTFRILQSYEIWDNFGEWITSTKPSFGPGIADRFQWASTITQEQAEQSQVLRDNATRQLDLLLGEDGILIIPTTPDVAPLLTMQGDELEIRRQQTLQLTSIAGLTGLPQLTIPVGLSNGVPIAVSIIAGKGQDLRLLKFVESRIKLLV